MFTYKPFFNYRKSGYKAFFKDILFILWNFYIRLTGRAKTILFYPEFPDWKSEIRKISMVAGFAMTSDQGGSFSYIINWEDTTFRSCDHALEKKHKIVNIGCKDISKRRVDQAFQEIFGHKTLIDPLKYVGSAVKKKNINGRHDGKIIQCPVEAKEDDYVYQKLIIHPQRAGYLVDYRVYIFKGAIPFILEQYKPEEDRFKEIKKYKLKEAGQEFSQSEIKKICAFSKRMGLDYGELDIIRDAKEGEIYIIDVNNTPHLGNTWRLPKAERRIKLKKSQIALKELLMAYEVSRPEIRQPTISTTS